MTRFYRLGIASLFVFLSTTLSKAQNIWDVKHLQHVKEQLAEPYYASAYENLIQEANNLLEQPARSVMEKPEAPLSGNKHDYMSLARYYWPDPTKPNGLPYINRDGVSNPEINKYDRNTLGQTANRITDLTLAWYFSQDEAYAQKATQLIRVFFLDKATCMNPNLNYAQVARGNHGDKGRSYGVLDAYSLVEVMDALKLLEGSKSFTPRDTKAMKKWVSELLKWMRTSEQGKDEFNASNNHGTACTAMIAAFSLYVGDEQTAREALETVPARMQKQIQPDGKQPDELRRTLAYHYSVYNLSFYTDLCQIAKKLGINLFDQGNLDKAYRFVAEYLDKEQHEWPYQQINSWDNARKSLVQQMYRVNPQYHSICAKHRIMDDSRFTLLWYDATWMDHAMFAASQQLKYALKVVREARASQECRQRNLVTPAKLTDGDHKLVMVGPNDWRSGFFPGEIWMMYQYTGDDFWRQSAVSETWPIEEAKWNRGTHDLGFMMYCSFGHAWDITGERSYRDVVVQASKSLITRFNPKVGCTRSWDHHKDRWTFPVIVDNMMNLEMLFRATQLTGDSTYWKIATTHANTTMRNHFRPDYSSYHVVDYDPETGEVRMKVTAQGNSDDSFWARGQSWGLYGYTMCYRFTHDPNYLKQAQGIADFWLSLPNMPEDGIPYWDMKLPKDKENATTPRDASAAAIVCSALYELSQYVPQDKAQRYLAYADKTLENLYRHYRAPQGTSSGFLLLHSTGNHPTNSEIDVPLNYADYYYVEALMRKLQAK